MRFLWSFRINQNFWCARRFRLRKCGESAPENMKIQIIFWCRQFRILCRRRRLEGRRPEKWRSYLETAKLFHASRRVTKMAKPFGNSEAVLRSRRVNKMAKPFGNSEAVSRSPTSYQNGEAIWKQRSCFTFPSLNASESSAPPAPAELVLVICVLEDYIHSEETNVSGAKWKSK